MQQDWRRDPIWQLIGIIVAIVIALMTQFNDPVPKIGIAIAGAVACGWIYFGNERLQRLFRHPAVVTVLNLLRNLLLFLLCAVLFILCVALFFNTDTLWGKIAAGAGGILAFSVLTAVYHNRSPFLTRFFESVGFLTGIVGITLVFAIGNPLFKIVLGIGAVLVEIITFVLLPSTENNTLGGF